jgi:NADH-quinone oxidoreductase subunit E
MQRIKTVKEKKVSELLLPQLREIQEKEGFLSEESLKELSIKIKIPITKIYEVATFYSFLSVKDKGKHMIRICSSPACYINGSDNIIDIFEKFLRIKVGETTKDKKFTLEKTSCIGCCDESPAALIDDKTYTCLNETKIKEILEKLG